MKDIGTVVDFILARRNIQRLNLIGWSWGTATMSTYSTQNPSKVERLILYAPGWIRQTASLVQAGPGPLGAHPTQFALAVSDHPLKCSVRAGTVRKITSTKDT